MVCPLSITVVAADKSTGAAGVAQELLLGDNYQGAAVHQGINRVQVFIEQRDATFGPVFTDNVAEGIFGAVNADITADIRIRGDFPSLFGPGELEPVFGIGVIQPDEIIPFGMGVFGPDPIDAFGSTGISLA